jgi:tRNA 2-thiouridine synthesizing protein A
MGLQCPGPIARIHEAMKGMTIGDELHVTASDPGFLSDVKSWCGSRGHFFVESGPAKGGVMARIRKAPPAAAGAAPSAAGTRKTIVVFSGDLDKVIAALIIANGALAMGDEVTLFFTFWGLSALRREPSVSAAGKPLLDRMFGWMLPVGLGQLVLSKMHMGGMGTAMMKYVMKCKKVESAPQLLAQAQAAGMRIVACSMSLDVMGLKPEELIDGVEIGGVATFLAESNRSNATLFI